MNQKSVEEVAHRSGLSISVVTALLNAGYCYVESLKAPVRWERTELLKEL